MQIEAERQDLFITRLWSFDLGHLIGHQSAWIEELLKLREIEPDNISRSVRSGWKTPFRSFDYLPPDLKELEKVARSCFDHAFREMSLKVSKTFKGFQLQAGVNLTEPGGYNVQHGHENVYLAGCFYLRVPENSGNIVFLDPRPAAKYSLGASANEMGSTNVHVFPREGQLLIFPGWLEHRVEENLSDQARISIVINATAKGSE